VLKLSHNAVKGTQKLSKWLFDHTHTSRISTMTSGLIANAHFKCCKETR